MIRHAFKRSGWAVLLALGALIVGCEESSERRAVRQAQAAQDGANESMSRVPIDLASYTLARETRDKRVTDSLEQAQSQLRSGIAKAPSFWPLKQHLGSVLVQAGDYWSLRTSETLTEARQNLNRAMLDWNHLQQLRLFVEGWQGRKKVYAAARKKLADDKATLESQLRGHQQQISQLNARHGALTGQAKGKHDQAKAAKPLADKLQEAASKSPNDLQKLAVALQKQAEIDKLVSEAGVLDNAAELVTGEKARAEIAAAAVTVRLEALQQRDARFVELLKLADNAMGGGGAAGAPRSAPAPAAAPGGSTWGRLFTRTLTGRRAAAAPVPRAGGEAALDQQTAELQSVVQSQLKPIVQLLEEADVSAKKATAAYQEAVRQLQAALSAVEGQNRRVPRGAEPDYFSELIARVELATAQCNLGRLLLMLSENAGTFADAVRLLAAAGGGETLGVTIDATASRAAGQGQLAAAEATLAKATQNSLVRRDKLWAGVLQERRDFLTKLAGGAAPAGGESNGGPGGPPGSP